MELDKCLEMIKDLRIRIINSKINLVSIGQFKCVIYISVRTKEEVELLKTILTEEELEICVIGKG
jgi:hypothetical protein